MSPKVVCGLCGRAFWPKRPWQRFCCASHKAAFWNARYRSRKARKRVFSASNALPTHSMRFSLPRLGETRDLRNVLGGLAARNPEFFRRLAKAVPKMEKAAE